MAKQKDKGVIEKANRIMRGCGLKAVYLAADGQWFSKKERAVARSNGKIKEFKLKKQ